MAQRQQPPTGNLTRGKNLGTTIAGASRYSNGFDIHPGAGANIDNRDNAGPVPRIIDLLRGPPQPSDLVFEFLAGLPELNRRSVVELGHTGFIWPSVDYHISLPPTPDGPGGN